MAGPKRFNGYGETTTRHQQSHHEVVAANGIGAQMRPATRSLHLSTSQHSATAGFARLVHLARATFDPANRVISAHESAQVARRSCSRASIMLVERKQRRAWFISVELAQTRLHRRAEAADWRRKRAARYPGLNGFILQEQYRYLAGNRRDGERRRHRSYLAQGISLLTLRFFA